MITSTPDKQGQASSEGSTAIELLGAILRLEPSERARLHAAWLAMEPALGASIPAGQAHHATTTPAITGEDAGTPTDAEQERLETLRAWIAALEPLSKRDQAKQLKKARSDAQSDPEAQLLDQALSDLASRDAPFAIEMAVAKSAVERPLFTFLAVVGVLYMLWSMASSALKFITSFAS